MTCGSSVANVSMLFLLCKDLKVLQRLLFPEVALHFLPSFDCMGGVGGCECLCVQISKGHMGVGVQGLYVDLGSNEQICAEDFCIYCHN